MIEISIICLLCIFLIFAIVRGESFKKEINVFKSRLNTSSNQSKFQLDVIMNLASEQEKVMRKRIELIKQTRGDIPAVKVTEGIVLCYAVSLSDIVEHNYTPKQAIERNLGRCSDVSLEALHNFIVDQSDDIKGLFKQNDFRGYISFCNQLIQLADG